MGPPGRKRVVLYGAAAAALVLLGLFLGRHLLAPAPENETGQDMSDGDGRPRLTATRVVGRRQGERQFELDAGAIGDDDEWVLLEAIEDGLLYRDGQVLVVFRADAGRWHRASNNLVLEGNVVLEYDGRVQMRTEELQWLADAELVVAPGPVHMTVDGDDVRAASMEADLDKERVRLEGDVRIVRHQGDKVEMATVVYWLAEDRLEGFGPGRLVLGGGQDAQP